MGNEDGAGPNKELFVSSWAEGRYSAGVRVSRRSYDLSSPDDIINTIYNNLYF
jgi:hypothetical protein